MSLLRFVLAMSLHCCLISVSIADPYTPGRVEHKEFSSFAKSFLTNHCAKCHGATGPKVIFR